MIKRFLDKYINENEYKVIEIIGASTIGIFPESFQTKGHAFLWIKSNKVCDLCRSRKITESLCGLNYKVLKIENLLKVKDINDIYFLSEE